MARVRSTPYGSFDPFDDVLLKGRPQTKAQFVMNVLAALLIPSGIFCGIYYLMAFEVHYNHWFYVRLAILGCIVLILLLAYAAYRAYKRRQLGDNSLNPMWVGYIALTSAICLGLAIFLGQQNYVENMRAYYDVQNLNQYYSVSPAVYRGNQLMDSGRIHFTRTTTLDTTHSMGFQNYDTYCVAPIVDPSQPTPDSYDFWAVGTNCCTFGAQPDFHCGEFLNPEASAGMRLMQEGQRPFYRLAVQQAEAAYNIKANHPIFLYWTASPDSELEAFNSAGISWFLRAMCTVCGAQTALTLLLAFFVAPK